jgi:hypothetical protein
MTVERWTDDRLDQLANSASDLRATSEALLQTVTIHQSNFEAIIAEIRTMQCEIRGLQLENRRMLQEMRGIEPDEPDESAQ